MASEQKSREDKGGGSNNSNKEEEEEEEEVEVEVEKDLVPKMASHYETLAEKARDPPTPGGKDARAEDSGKDDNRKKSSGEESQQKQGKGKDRGSAEKTKGGKEDVLDRAREKVSSAKDTAKEVVGKTLGSAKEAVAGITERTKELVIGKTEEETRDRQEEEEEQEESRHAGDGDRAQELRIGGIMGAVGEALVEIAISTKDLVFGKGKGDLQATDDRDVVYDLGYGGRGEKGHQDEH